MRHILITGGNTGIGKATAISLAAKGNTIILACRNEYKANEAIKEIKASSKNKEIHYLKCDLASFKSIKNCAAEYRKQFRQLDILINNAGLITDKLQFTKDDFELQFGVNHLGHFLLTNQLIDLLNEAPEARIINVSSGAHYQGKIDFSSFKGEQGPSKYDGKFAYRQSKLANILFTKELVKRHPNIWSFSLHPGIVKTEIAIKNGNKRLWRVLWKMLTPLKVDTARGAKTTVHLSTSNEVLSSNGKYFEKEKETVPCRLANDIELAKKLWEVSVELTS